MSSDAAAELFFAYSHMDEVVRNELETHFAMLKRDGTISAWHDRRIVPGDEWKNSIDVHLENAEIILLIVTREFPRLRLLL